MNYAEGSVITTHELREHHEVQFCRQEPDGSWTTMGSSPVLGMAVVSDADGGTFVEPLVVNAEGAPELAGVVAESFPADYRWWLAYKGHRLELKTYEPVSASRSRRNAEGATK